MTAAPGLDRQPAAGRGAGCDPADVRQGRVLKLASNGQARWRDTNWLFEATRLGADGEIEYTKALGELSLRQRAEKLLANPELTFWVAAELRDRDRVARQQAREAAELDRELRDRDLPITVERYGFAAEGQPPTWNQLTLELDRAATAVRNADGKTDLAAAVARVQAAHAAIEAVLA